MVLVENKQTKRNGFHSTKLSQNVGKNLNVTEIIKLLEVNIEKNLLDIDIRNDFMYMASKAKATIGEINKWEYIELKSST